MAAPVARMLTARTAASASQLARARPVAVIQPDGGSRSEPSRCAQARMVWSGSAAGRRSIRDPRRSTHPAGRSSAPRSRGRRAAATAATRTATASAPPGTATAAPRVFPDASPPPTTTRAAAAEEITPPASSDQPASGASAPCRVKRRNVKAVARAGPASGTETDTALAA
jgi:hypothetical protein